MRHLARHRQRGIALVVVLWLVVLITVIGSSHARNIRIETSLAFNHVGTARARALAEAGINRAIMELLVKNTDTRWPFDGTAQQIQLTSGSVNIAIRDASGLLDLNRAELDQLGAVLDAAGAAEGVRQELVDAILDWRDKDQLRRLHGAEDNDYRHADLDWGARDGPFASVDELRYVLGMTHELFERLAPYLTVHSSRRDVNLEYAPPWLVAALSGRDGENTENLPDEADEGLAGELDEGLAGELDESLAGELDESLAGGITQATGPFHITAWATSSSGAHASVDAVLSIARSGEAPYRILSWHEPARSRKMTAE